MSSVVTTSTAVKVALRIRPVFEKDRILSPRGSREVVIAPSSTSSFSAPFPSSDGISSVTDRQVLVDGRKKFTYDRVFPPGASQPLVYDTCVKAMVERFVEGFNATVMAYGQTGSGKTYTMGSSEDYVGDSDPNSVASQNQGIIPRAISDAFSLLNSKTAQDQTYKYTVSATFLEVYNEDLIDLLSSQPLNSRTPVIVQETGSGTVVSGCTSIKLRNSDDALSLLLQGLESRQTSTTDMNISSSRSHAIFTLTLVQETRSTPRPVILTSRFHFVDLAGSERLQRTGAIGIRQREGIHINSGLLALGNVISALADDSRRTTHIPYRDSKLTRLLQDSLGGNSNTLMIACISPTEHDLAETLNTLKYANRAHKVRNLLSLNRDTGDDEVSRLKELVERLKEEVKSLKTNPNSASDIPPVMSTASSAEVEMLQKDNQSLRRKLEEQKEENLRLRAHRDYLSNELAFVQSEFTLKIRQNSPAPSESALSDVFSDVESVTSYATGVSSIPDTDSNVGGSRIPISKRPMTRPSSLIPRSTTPGTTVPPSTPLPSTAVSETIEEQDRLIRRLRFDLREITAAAQDYLRELEVLRDAAERHQAGVELGEVQAADLRETVEVLRGELEGARRRIDELEKGRGEHEGVEMYIAGLEAQLEKRQGQVESLENELERARADESRRDIVLVDLERRLRESGNTTESFTRISELEVEVTRYRENLETCQHRIDELMNVEKETLISPPMSVPSSPPLALSRSHESENADLKKRLEEVETALEGCKKRLGVANEDNGALLDRLMEVEKELAESMEEIVKRDESPRGPSVEVSNVELDYVVVKNDLANALKKLADAEFFLAEVNDERVRLTTQFEDLVSQSTSRSHESAIVVDELRTCLEEQVSINTVLRQQIDDLNCENQSLKASANDAIIQDIQQEDDALANLNVRHPGPIFII